jgi:uncharacterized integral membrane protein
MTTDPTPSRSDESSTPATGAGAGSPQARGGPRFTRASAAWVAVGAALLLLILLIVFMLQNPTTVEIRFLGAVGTIPLGLALLIAAVGGGVVVTIAGIARITQLRINIRRSRRSTSGP